MRRVFLSHGGADWDAIKPVADQLIASSARVLGWDDPAQEQLFVGSALQQLEAAQVTVVILTASAKENDYVSQEIMHSIRKDKGIVAVRLDRDAVTPHELFVAGAEVLDWDNPEDVEYLPKALVAAERGARVLAAAVQRGAGSGAPCARPMP